MRVIFLNFVILLMVQGSIQHSVNPRIINGQDAFRNQFPFTAFVEVSDSIFEGYSHQCAGVVYDEYHILTSGVCVNIIDGRFSNARVKVGMHFINRTDASVQSIGIYNAIVHEDYSTDDWNFDIGLIYLTDAITNPVMVKLSQQQFPYGDVLMVGWGDTLLRMKAKVLQYASLKIMNIDDCEKIVRGINHDTKLCIHTPNSAIAAYKGDAGGPIVQYVNGEPEIIALISTTTYPDMKVGAPTTGTKVAYFLTWIYGKIHQSPNLDANSNWLTPLLTKNI